MKEINIIINNKVLNEYCEQYFIKYPRRKKKPIDKPFPPSLNRFIAMKRMQQNDIKQKYKEFSVWLASYYKIANLNLNKAKMIYTFYFLDHRRRDMDNLMLSPKFFQDGFVEANVLKDDCGDILKIEFESFQYDKLNPRVEIILRWDI
jgi:Holliday junction resolvase RusA-like endonuclease